MKEQRNTLTLSGPASEWRDAWPSGNGQVGALVFGDVHHEKIVFNHEELWLYGDVKPLPNISDSLGKVRELIGDKKYKEAHDLHRDKLHNEGYKPKMADFSPVCTLEILNADKTPFTEYERSLNMESGEIRVHWQQGETKLARNLFVSRSSKKIYYSMDTTESSPLNFDMKLIPLGDNTDRSYLESHNLCFSMYTENELMIIRGHDEKGTSFGARIFIKSESGERAVEDNVLKIRGAQKVELEIEIFVGSDFVLLEKTYSDFDYQGELLIHSNIHKELYNRQKLKLSGKHIKRVQDMYNYGRYLFISSTGSALPPHLQGLWNGDNHPIWNCFYMINENVQMMQWQGLPGNMPELMLSLFNYYESNIDDYKENAEKLFGCRGMFIPANTVPETGLITDLQGHLIYWTGGAAWLSRLYYDYYLYTEDITFLENRALPFMLEAATFYEDYTYKNSKGYLEFCPSISPENAPTDFNSEYNMDAECNITINATMDVALCKELLTNLVEGSKLCGINSGKIDLWEDMINKLPAYTKNSDGAICEWLHNDFADNYHHRHESHVYPFFPGNEMSKNHEMAPAIEVAIDKRFEIGMKEQTGWSVVHMANIYARLGRGDRALECLDILLEYCTGDNLFTYHNDWREGDTCQAKPDNFDKRVFQMDANMGYPAAILEMLVFSEPGKITLLPGLPSSMKEGEITGVLCRGNILLDMTWSEKCIEFRVKSEKDQPLLVGARNSSSEPRRIYLQSGIWYISTINI